MKVGDKAVALSPDENGYGHRFVAGEEITCTYVYSDGFFGFENDRGLHQILSKTGFKEPRNTIQLNQTYTSKNGTKWECIGIKDGIAFLSFGGEGDAYRFLLNGENLSQGGGLWDIQWEPVVEWAYNLVELESYGALLQIEYPVIDGKPDFTQAKVGPV